MRGPAWLHRWWRDGFVLLRGLPRRRADALLALLGRVARRAPGAAERRRWVMESDLPAARRGAPLPPGRDAVFILGEPERLSPLFLQAAAAPLAAIAPALGTKRPVFHFANVTQKAPGFGSGIAWHRDFPNRYITTRRGRFLRALLCLEAMGPGNGGTALRPGSQRGAGRASIVPRCPAGAMLLLHPRLLHGGAPNRGSRPRRLLVAQWGRPDDPPLGPEREAWTGRRFRPPPAP
ncbi:phytanoyl-CoA dioxygenase family protein [Falsiroseomonas selenitidurans]|uniref:Phytanoyl-CoA dioxygenase family protein n=1 Tax=Falsiroseomonas selenitidurans TaxID=2716335 RepID=A0ABX1E554_9PROT|nr:phytanoyl-CoA dioxygenase family protein [Falsiroseomonas selenitidurans]NKC32106.1 phytanoyl-CoA dioxygenase family protein [Falsiroseomonas selenitidurans]